jgi:hypothetical protein
VARRDRPSPWLPGAAATLLASALIAGACGDPPPPARGFGSRQLLQTNDRTLALISFGTKVVTRQASDGTAYYTAEIDPDIMLYRTGDPAGTDVVYWSLNLIDASVTRLGDKVPDVVVPPPDAAPKYLPCRWETTDTGSTLFIEESPGSMVTIDRIVDFTGCPRVDDPYLVAVRQGDAGRGRLWTGPYYNLQQAPLAVSIREITLTNIAELDPANRYVDVVGALDAEPDGWGIHRVALDDLTTTPVVSPLLAGGSWAPGATPEGTLESDSLDPDTVEIADGAFYTYQRRMRDGGQTMFVRVNDGAAIVELALFRRAGLIQPVVLGSTIGGGGVGTVSVNGGVWQDTATTVGQPDFVHFWDADQSRLVSCPLPADRLTPEARLGGLPNAGGRNLMFSTLGNGSSADEIGPLLVVSRDAPPGDACRLLAPHAVFALTWSSEALAWLQATETVGEHQLWTATLDGGQPRLLGTGWLRGPRFVSPFDVDFYFGSDLVSVDVRDDPVRVHYLAEEAYGAVFSDMPSVVTGFDYNSQDATGTLGVIHRITGERRIVSRAVDQYRLLYRQGDGSLTAVYYVRGRNPSPQDGIWLATLTADDLD